VAAENARLWLTMKEPGWQSRNAGRSTTGTSSTIARSRRRCSTADEVDPEVKKTFDKLGIPIEEQMLLAGVAVAV
jgi:Fe-S cluster assembly protein SufB